MILWLFRSAAVIHHQTDSIVARDVHTGNLTEALKLEMEVLQPRLVPWP